MTEESFSAAPAMAAEPAAPAAGHEAELQHLRRLVAASVVYVIVIATGAIAGLLVTFDDARSASLRSLALVSLLGGVLGSAGRNLLDILQRLEWGWELADGTQIDRRQMRKDRRREELERRAGRREEAEADVEAAYSSPSMWTPDVYFGVHVVPLYLLYPLIGAVLGFALFAGVTGGLLLASGDSSPTYSSTGLVFLAFLSGFFSETFLRRLAAAADALFGVESDRRKPGAKDGESQTRDSG